MTDSQINIADVVLGSAVKVDTKFDGTKHTPQHGIRDGMDETLGSMADAAATSDAGTFSLIALFKRHLARLTTGMVAQLGARTVAQSPAVNLATDDPQIGTKVTAVAALPTGGTGIIGWLSNIWSALVATLTVAGNAASGATDSGNPIKIGAVYNSTPPTPSSGQRIDAQADPSGNLRVRAVGVAANALDGVSNTMSVFQFSSDASSVTSFRLSPFAAFTFNGATWDRMVKPNNTSRIASAAASTNPTSAKASAGNAFKVFGENKKAATVYLKLYNKASAPTVGTDTPVITIPLAASSVFDRDIGGTFGHYFSTGIAYALTAGAPDSDTTALTAGDVLALTLTFA